MRLIDAGGQMEAGVQSDVRILGLHVALDEHLQGEAGQIDAVERCRADAHVGHAIFAVGVGIHANVMDAGEDGEQRIGVMVHRRECGRNPHGRCR